MSRYPVESVPEQVRAIAGRLAEAGHEAWYVGGAVRDRLYADLTGRAPVRTGDYDIATSALPAQVQSLFRRTVPVGIEHGTVAVLDANGTAHEVTTFRKDVATDGRHAVVAFGVSLEDDLARRDFTINAVAVHPESGEIRDPFGGAADLAAGVIRAVGRADERFREDRLRVLRALRFASALGFSIENDTWAAVLAAAGELEHLSRERVRDEWMKMLLTSVPSVGVGLWRRAGVLSAVWPELGPLTPEQDDALDRVAGRDPVVVTAVAMSCAGVAPLAALSAAQRLRFSNRDMMRIGAVAEALAGSLPKPAGPSLRRWMARHRQHLEDVLAAVPAEHRAALEAAVGAERAAGVPLAIGDLAIDGSDLLASGVPAGPEVGAVLRRLLDEVLEHPESNNRDYLLSRPCVKEAAAT